MSNNASWSWQRVYVLGPWATWVLPVPRAQDHLALQGWWLLRADHRAEERREPGPGFLQPRQRSRKETGPRASVSVHTGSNPSFLRSRNTIQTWGAWGHKGTERHRSFTCGQVGDLCSPPTYTWKPSNWPLPHASTPPISGHGPHPKGSSWSLVWSQVLPGVPARAAPPMGRTLDSQRTGRTREARVNFLKAHYHRAGRESKGQEGRDSLGGTSPPRGRTVLGLWLYV